MTRLSKSILLLAAASLVAGCMCSEQGSLKDSQLAPDTDQARAVDQGVPDQARDKALPDGDQGLPDGDQGLLWKRDFGPAPDLNLALCRDSGDLDPAPDAAPPLSTKPGLKWKLKLTTANLSISSPVLGLGGAIHFTTTLGIHAVSQKGQLLWSVSKPPGTALYGNQPLAIKNLLVFGSLPGKVHAVSQDGQALWSRSLDGPFDPSPGYFTSPPLRGAGDVIWIGGADRTLYKLDTQSNILQRTALPGHPLRGLTAVDDQGNVYAVIWASRRVVSISPAGKLRWSRTLHPSYASGVSNLALTADGGLVAVVGCCVYSGQKYVDVMVLDRACGAERWRHRLSGGSPIWPMLVGPDGTVYLHITWYGKNKPSKIVAISSKGKLRWEAVLEDSVHPGPMEFKGLGPIGADGTLHARVQNGGPPGKKYEPDHIRGYSGQGKLLWKVPIEGMNSLSNPLLLQDGSLIFGAAISPSKGTYLFSIQTTSPGLAPSGWPRAYHDNQSSGNQSTPL